MTINFSAGPGILPPQVLRKVQAEFLNVANTGVSIVEVSHRSKEFINITNEAFNDFRKLLEIPDNYEVLFMQGGASTQFSACVYNLVTDASKPVDYIVTGQWSSKAFKEAKRLVYSPQDGLLDPSTLKFSPNASFVYYCDNETVDGVELPTSFINALPKDIPIVCDMSSNFCSRKFNVENYGVIFGGAQKNIGPAGLTIVIVRKDLLGLFEKCPLKGPMMLDYKVCVDNGSMYNTPPVFSIYVSGLVFKHLLENGGIEGVEELNRKKSTLLYSALDAHPEKYQCPVPKQYRSRMNVVFRVLKDGKPNPEAEKRFCKEAEESRGMICLAGHRSVGGMRASLYNALTIEDVQQLVSFLGEFAP